MQALIDDNIAIYVTDLTPAAEPRYRARFYFDPNSIVMTSGNAHYSFDFYVPQTMFNINAAKAGTVWLFSDNVANNNHDAVNYLVLQDTSTNPVTYQLYLHLAQGSIPSELPRAWI